MSTIFLLPCYGCREKVDKYGFLSEEALLENEIPDLPELPHGKDKSTRAALPKALLLGEYGLFYCTLSYEEFQTYVEEVYEYLLSLNFKYLGYEGKMLGIGDFEFFEGEMLSDFYVEDDTVTKVSFIWANELNEANNAYLSPDWHSLELFYYYETQIFEDGFTYNVEICTRHTMVQYKLTEENQ